MPTNLPLGTYVQDGVRSGPFYTGQLPSTLVADDNGVITSSSHDAYGPGILFSPQNTWNITPYTAALDNVVATTAAAQVTGAGDLTLTGDAAASVYNNGTIQLDVPRAISVTITGAVAGNRTVTIFGTDWYGMPLQHSYVVQAIQNYPVLDYGPPVTLTGATKAFYTINSVYINGALGGGSSISLGTMDVFGLPYLINDFGDVTSIGWNALSDLTTNTTNAYVQSSNLTSIGAFVAGDSTDPATGLTGDVRGLYAPSSASDGAIRLLFTAYIQGADTWLNQVANRQQNQLLSGQTITGVAQATLTSADLYGVSQYYTGTPG